MRGPGLRILLGGASSLGPGKVALLEEIERHGSISAAARAMGMSYRRAWLLVDAMNTAFREPLVTTATGGAGGGGAAVTDFGREVLRRYRAMEAKAHKAIEADLERFDALLRRAS
ncbi:MAG: LysR family transcriptional regulator [Burkholderiales bacterium]